MYINLLIGLRTKVTVLIDCLHNEERHIFPIGFEGFWSVILIERLLGNNKFVRRPGCTAYGFSSSHPIGIVNHHSNFTRLILHIVPTQTVAVDERFVLLHRSASIGFHTLIHSFAYTSLTLPVDEQLGRRIVGITINRCHFPFTTRPSPMGQQVNGFCVFVPMTAIEPITIFRESCEVEDSEIATTCIHAVIVRGGFAQIVESCPHKLTNHPIVIVLQRPVVLWDV